MRRGDPLSVAIDHRQGAFHLRASFEAPPGVTALFGHSGSGKTTLVDIVGGLVRPTHGRVEVGGTVLLDTARGLSLPVHRRRIGYVFQDARLFPHLSVRQNLLFGRWFAPRREPGPDLAAVAGLLGVGHLLGRRPAGLSGGERQRVAIGRALLAKPRLLLMDEPLAALDAARKAEILPYLERLRDEVGVPILYVSHSVPEVVRLADTVVMLENGRVIAAGAAGDVLAQLDLPGFSGTREAGAILDAEVSGHDLAYGLTLLSTPAGPLQVPWRDLPAGTRRRVQIGARDVLLSTSPPDGLSALNVLPATVAAMGEPEGASVLVRLDCRGTPLLARLTRKSLARLGLAPGSPVHAIIKSVALEDGAGSGGAWRG